MKTNCFDWDREINIWEKWWNKELGRPIFQISTPLKAKPVETVGLTYNFFPMYDFSIPAEDIIKQRKKQQPPTDSYRDASYPRVWMNFGPGVLPALIGGKGYCEKEGNTVWFGPGKFADCDLSEISIKLDRETEWFRRLEEFFVAATKHLGGEIHIGQTDIGGALDILSSLRPGEMLMFDMFDQPDEVKRLIWEIHDAWFELFEYFNSLLPTSNHGYSAWAGLLSSETHYMLQCDFAYMISPNQFGEFVLPELAESCKRIGRPFYHLDGKGQLAHLDQLLSIPELKGIQWVPGAGAPDCSNWPEVYREIVAADRLTQVHAYEVTVIEKVLEQTDKPELMLFTGSIKPNEEERLNKIYHKYGIKPV